jgi:hypothetical protein
MARSHAELTKKLTDRFRRISEILYDTSLPPPEVDREIRPYLAETVAFVDPWQHEKGLGKYRLGLAGFHTLFRFHLEIFQIGVQLDDAGKSGRAFVEGVMHLKQLERLFTFPLRTILVYHFTVTDPGKTGGQPKFLIERHEEMWSFADLIAGVPGLGWIYTKLFRRGFAYAFLGASYLSARARGVLPR